MVFQQVASDRHFEAWSSREVHLHAEGIEQKSIANYTGSMQAGATVAPTQSHRHATMLRDFEKAKQSNHDCRTQAPTSRNENKGEENTNMKRKKKQKQKKVTNTKRTNKNTRRLQTKESFCSTTHGLERTLSRQLAHFHSWRFSGSRVANSHRRESGLHESSKVHKFKPSSVRVRYENVQLEILYMRRCVAFTPSEELTMYTVRFAVYSGRW